MKSVKLFLFCFYSLSLFSQTDSAKTCKDYFQFNGYIKDLQIASFENNLDDIVNDNLIHNRLNFRFFPTEKWTTGLEIRNRIFFGESVDAQPNYATIVDEDQGLVDLSWPVVDSDALVFLTQLDRLWVEFADDKWEVRAGRQRINWGMNLFWNSNDLFNAYSLVDFDYEERPGTDAIRIQRYFKDMKSLDFALKPGKYNDDWVGALRYQFNKWQYDFQFIAGWWNEDYVLGTGWAGNIGNAGFKGEVTYFRPEQSEADGTLSASVSADYVFDNQLFLTGGFLLNSEGTDEPLVFAQNIFLAPLSSKNLMQTKYNGILSASYPINPLLNGSIVAIYSPGTNLGFFMPSLGYSISINWEIALFAQSFWAQVYDFENIGNSVFIRMKGNF